jgi:hypothetical protein
MIIRFTLCVWYLAASAQAVHIPGTSVDLEPPPGFTEADRFPGFMNKDTGSSIMVTEIPGPYEEIIQGFEDPAALLEKGMTLLTRERLTVAGRSALLLHLKQTAYGTEFNKWTLIAKGDSTTIIISATYPATLPQAHSDELLKAIRSTRLRAPGANAAFENLPFEISPAGNFRVGTVLGKSVILTPDGQFPVKDERVPFMIAGISFSDGLAIAHRKKFAEKRLKKIEEVNDIALQASRPVTIGALSGYRTVASANGKQAGTKLTVCQIMLFEPTDYCIIVGICPSDEEDSFLPLFDRTVKTFVLKERESNRRAASPVSMRLADDTMAPGTSTILEFTISGSRIHEVEPPVNIPVPPSIQLDKPSIQQKESITDGTASASTTFKYLLTATQAGRFTIGPVSYEFRGRDIVLPSLALDVSDQHTTEPVQTSILDTNFMKRFNWNDAQE